MVKLLFTQNTNLFGVNLHQGVKVVETRTIEAFLRAYVSLEQTAIDLYEEFELAVIILCQI